MYSTCTYCLAPLGSNDALERFPVGRRVAIDQARGRLWAVCAVCGQWNLSPIETRWEAIEDGERLYRDARLRVTTEQIGLARLRDGTELIRIGEPQRPEFAAWRYGERFAKRWRFAGRLGAASGAAVAVLGKAGGFFTAFVSAAPVLGVTAVVATVRVVERRVTAARVQVPGVGAVRLTYGHVAHAKVLRSRESASGWVLRLPHEPAGVAPRIARFDDPFVSLEGEAARSAAAAIFPRLNRSGGRKQDVDQAVRALESHRDLDSLMRLTATFTKAEAEGAKFAAVDAPPRDERERVHIPPGDLVRTPAHLRLAVEMALHEDAEREAMRGELAALENRWKEAEEVAAIADNLIESPALLKAMERLRLR